MPLTPPQLAIPGAPNRAKSALEQAKARLQHPPAALQAAKARGETALRKLQQSPLRDEPVVLAMQEYIKNLLARGDDPDDFVRELREKAERDLASRQHVIRFLGDVLNLVRAKEKQVRLRADVLRAARTRQITSAQAAERLTSIFDTPYPFLAWAERRLGPLTIGVAMQAEAGLAVGVGATEGLSGLRYHCVCHSIGGSIATGAVADVDIGVQLSASSGKPAAGKDVSVEVSLGGGYSGTFSVTAAFKPTLRQPTWDDNRLVDYEFKGASVSLGVGGGFDIGVSVGVTQSTMLFGTTS